MLSIEPQLWIAAYAALVATVVAGWNIWKEVSERRRHREERKRVRIEIDLVTAKNSPDGRTYLVCPLVVSNLGREPVIIQSVVARGANSSFWPGEFAEPGAAYGVRERVLPRKLEAGETVELPLLTAAAFTTDLTEIAVIDNEGHEFTLGEAHIRVTREKAQKWLHHQLRAV